MILAQVFGTFALLSMMYIIISNVYYTKKKRYLPLHYTAGWFVLACWIIAFALVKEYFVSAIFLAMAIYIIYHQRLSKNTKH